MGNGGSPYFIMLNSGTEVHSTACSTRSRSRSISWLNEGIWTWIPRIYRLVRWIPYKARTNVQVLTSKAWIGFFAGPCYFRLSHPTTCKYGNGVIRSFIKVTMETLFLELSHMFLSNGSILHVVYNWSSYWFIR